MSLARPFRAASLLSAVVLLAAGDSRLEAAEPTDWPTWRYDAARSAFTPHAPPDNLELEWTLALPAPDPAFDYHFRLCADQTFEPVAAGGLLFVPSNVSDSVTAYDITNGEERWRFIAEGPVRFAPLAAGDRVFFASDDGCLYSTDGRTGELRWRVRGAPEDRPDHRMLVNGRMSSRWPARGGPVLSEDGKTIYFGCGIWPAEGVFLLAVDADTGAVQWRRDDIRQIDDGFEEHGKLADLGLPPHGYLARIGDRIAMPSGRALAAFVDPETGSLDPYNAFYAKVYPVPRGSWAVCGNSQYWFQGGAVFGTDGAALDQLPVGPLDIEEFARLCNQTVAWAENQIADGNVDTRNDGNRKLVVFDPRAPGVALNFSARSVSPSQLFQLETRPVLNMAPLTTRHEIGERALPVFTGAMMIRSEFKDPASVAVERGKTHVTSPSYDVIRAYHLSEAFWQVNPLPTRSGFSRQLVFEKAWELDSSLTVRILAGDQLFAGADNKIVALSLSETPGKAPEQTWEAEIDGFPTAVLAASDKLIVVTDKGRLSCFGNGAKAPAVQIREAEPVAASGVTDSQWTKHVADLLKSAPSFGGYALVLGWNSGGLVDELIRQSALSIIVAEPDPAVADDARRRLAARGLPCSRAQVITAASPATMLPPCFADVELSESLEPFTAGARAWTRAAVDALRPHNGVALLSLRPKLLEEAENHAAKSGGFTFDPQGRWTAIRRVAAPTGADEWTHESANASNTFVSKDSLAVPPFGLLWYSGSIDRFFSPSFEYHHNRNPYPTIAGGRMFLVAANEIHAVDIYTGRHLWKTPVPSSQKADSRLNDHRTFSRPTDQNIIAVADALYVFRETEAVVLDPVTGETKTVFTVPEEFRGSGGNAAWDEARIDGDRLFISVAGHLVALDRHSGEILWTHDGAQDHLAFTLGAGRVFAIDYPGDRARRREKIGAFETQMESLDAANGSLLWAAPLKVTARREQSENSAGKPTWSGIVQENPLKPSLAFNKANGIAIAVMDRNQFFALDVESGQPRWHYASENKLADLTRFEAPAVTSDLIICGDGAILDAATGRLADLEAIGPRGTGCNRVVGSDSLITFRSALPCVLDLETGKRTYFTSTRLGCTNSMIPAGGLLNAPNFAHGCVCNYPFLASFALVHLPQAARWAPREAPDMQFQSRPGAD